ncbi:prolyl oligopeptidase family serine peptidase [Nocardia uniformis]|uniref:Prolyl oligopeptidase family serine peptidase n=2 Tax=Nocardia uniformis TaxID=53432 RepID=A0A849C3W3_9NOCA|nr:prolyl oligopeptidase family serine peptidase [Nocardia uniformis]
MIAAITLGAPMAHANDLVTDGISITRSDGTTASGTVYAPAGATGLPGVVLVHGSGDGRDEHYDQVAAALAGAGIVALRYDKRTEDYTPAHRDYSLLADDALAGLAALRNRPEVAPDRVGIWGLSEGGWVAPLAVSRSADAAFLITVGANSFAPAAQQAWANETRFVAGGVRGSMLEVLARNGIRQLVGAGQFAQADYDAIPVLERIPQPVLAIWGELDRLTPPGDSLRDFQSAFERVGKTNYTLRTLPNAQHGGHATTDGFDKLPELAPGYIQLMADWVHGLPDSAARQVDPPAAQGQSAEALEPLSRWESATVQLSLLLGIVLGFGGYALTGAVRRWRLPNPRPARILLSAAMIAIVGTVAQLLFMLTTRATSFGPLLFGRTLPWLAVQLLAALAVVTLGVIIARSRSTLSDSGAGARARWILLVCGGAGFTLWALYWGLLIP